MNPSFVEPEVMDDEARIEDAKQRIGESSPDDAILAPETHLSHIEDPLLRALLQHGDVRTAAAKYHRHDTQALEAQQQLRSLASRVNALLLGAAASSSSIMAITVLLDQPQPYAAIAAGLATVLSGLAGASRRQLGGARLLEEWMRERASAEMQRLRYFKLLTRKATPAPRGSQLPLVLLEYFRRYQLQAQIAFYTKKSKSHAAAARTTVRTTARALSVVAIATGLTAILSSFDPAWSALAAIALTAQAFAASAANREALSQDERNAERYRGTLDGLERCAERLDDVRRAVAAGRLDLFEQFVDSVHEGLSAEHRQWTEDIGDVGSAIDRLGDLVEKFKLDSATSPIGG